MYKVFDLSIIDDEEHYLLKAEKTYIKRLRQALNPLKKVLSKKQYNDLITNKLQVKSGKFNEAQYIQSACEITVLSYFANKFPNQFIYENKINPPKDVDLSVKIDQIHFHIEIKCVDNIKLNALNDDFEIQKVSTFGRYPDEDFKNDYVNNFITMWKDNPNIDTSKKVTFVNNRDLKLKDFLESGQSKFKNTYSKEDINILIICIGGLDDFDSWDGYFYGYQGILKDDSFIEHSTFDKVDFVILTNLEHRHCKFFEKNEIQDHWKLNRAYSILYQNKYSRIYKYNKEISGKELNILVPDIMKNTNEFYSLTGDNNGKQFVHKFQGSGIFKHTYYANYVLKKRGDQRFKNYPEP